jgi:hypothetical protein
VQEAALRALGHALHLSPTLGEAVQEAALRALGHALHLPNLLEQARSCKECNPGCETGPE